MQRRHIVVLAVLLAAVAVSAAGCGGSAETQAPSSAGSSKSTRDQRETARSLTGRPSPRNHREHLERAARSADPKRRRTATKKLDELDRKRQRADDRKFDQAFKPTPFGKLVDRLAIRKPPLYVEQYVEIEGSHKLYTAVEPKRFFCGRSPSRRKAAVRMFYSDASRLFSRNGFSDFVQVVTPVSETAEKLPALAVGREGSVSLTSRGKGKGPC